MKIITWLKTFLKKPDLTPENSGSAGEALASKYLVSIGYKIVETNFTTKFGEIDIIAIDHNHLVFVEVKYRKDAADFGGAKAAVNWKKQKKIIKVAQFYLAQKYKTKSDAPNSRFDVIAIDGEMELKNITHFKKAFSSSKHTKPF